MQAAGRESSVSAPPILHSRLEGLCPVIPEQGLCKAKRLFKTPSGGLIIGSDGSDKARFRDVNVSTDEMLRLWTGERELGGVGVMVEP